MAIVDEESMLVRSTSSTECTWGCIADVWSIRGRFDAWMSVRIMKAEEIS